MKLLRRPTIAVTLAVALTLSMGQSLGETTSENCRFHCELLRNSPVHDSLMESNPKPLVPCFGVAGVSRSFRATDNEMGTLVSGFGSKRVDSVSSRPDPEVWETQDHSASHDWDKLRQQVLSLGRLTDAPKTYEAAGFESDGLIRPLYFEGLRWKGKPTRVFAWLGIPETRLRGKEKMPAVVLVHGGGGTAFKEWTRKWNQRGFVAISIAVEGQTDQKAGDGGGWKRHQWAGPARVGIYQDSDQSLPDQWMYHAVADTILANSLLRQHPLVDANRIGLMGISWGGVITSTVIGIDDRFAFAIPTYGCGSLADAQNQYGRALGDNSVYREVWDPALRMANVKMPVLWLSWTGDLHFPLEAQRSGYLNSNGPYQVALLPNMQHGHGVAWNPPDSYVFAESVIKSGRPWCRQVELTVGRKEATFEFNSLLPIDKAVLVKTSDLGFTGNRTWHESEIQIQQEERRITGKVKIPDGTTGWFVRLQSGRLVATSDYQGSK